MANILLLDSGLVLGKEIARSLGDRRHSVTVCECRCDGLKRLEEFAVDPNLVVLDMSRNTKEDWAILSRLSKFRLLHAPGPMILCIATIYRGPDMELKVERKGARLVYVR